MGRGFLTVTTTAGSSTIPIEGARVIISQGGITLYTLLTDEDGNTETVSIDAPDKAASLDPAFTGVPFSNCDVSVNAVGFVTKSFHSVRIFDTITTIQPVNMTPDEEIDCFGDNNCTESTNQGNMQETYMPVHGQLLEEGESERHQKYSDYRGISATQISAVTIPFYVTVHLGPPASNASDVTVPFRDYIKNVASHEIYPTWDQSALEANIYCQISLFLNRVFTEWYRSRGFKFDITNSTSYDQYFVYQGAIFANISELVDQIFNRFIQREGHKEPFFAEYCNGTTVTCPGLSQTGSQWLAVQGYNPLEILRYYYPKDVLVTATDNMQYIQESFPGYPLSQGSSGNDVRILQDRLNRIRINYPSIPQINPVDGVFGAQTTDAVKAFQSVSSFGIGTVNGIVDRTTWFKMVYVYTGGAKKLGELTSEGIIIGVGRTPPTTSIGEGARGREVGILQYLLRFISYFYPAVPSVIHDFNFGPDTTNSVRDFQRAFGITSDGFVGRTTWNRLYEIYWGLNDNVPIPPPEEDTIPEFPGTSLRIGSSGMAVQQVQTCLNTVATRYPTIPKVTADGLFGNNTHNAVVAFQRIFGLAPDGVVGPVTWNMIMTKCAEIGGGSTVPPFPGTSLRIGSSGTYVRQIQTCLNNLSSRYPTIPKLLVDGQFGSNTFNAVVAFQRIFGLTQDGIVGPITWNRIMTECANTGGGTVIPPFPGTSLRVGSSGAAVTQIQTCLNNISSRHPSIPRLVVDGQFGNNTRNSVIAFQRIYELAPDGIVGPITWNRIMTECSTLSQGVLTNNLSDAGVNGLNTAQKPLNTDVVKFMLLSRMFNQGSGAGGWPPYPYR